MTEEELKHTHTHNQRNNQIKYLYAGKNQQSRTTSH